MNKPSSSDARQTEHLVSETLVLLSQSVWFLQH